MKFVRVFSMKVLASSGSEKLISNARINFASVVRRLSRARGLPMQLYVPAEGERALMDACSVGMIVGGGDVYRQKTARRHSAL